MPLDDAPIPPLRRCAVCGKPEAQEFRPFCSKRCADVDLGRWLKGNYVIPGRDAHQDERLPTPPENGDGED